MHTPACRRNEKVTEKRDRRREESGWKGGYMLKL
jgi:hypothetical protein